MNPEKQQELMRDWFFEHFEEPNGNIPFDDEEDEYFYIWGGPFSADVELFSKFGEVFPEDVIDELAKELAQQSFEWSKKPDASDLDNEYFDAVTDNKNFADTFKSSIERVKSLASMNIDSLALEQHLLQMLFVSVITSLETFLADAFINTVLQNQMLIRKFVETNPDFSEEKLTLNKVFHKIEGIQDEVKSYLSKIMWHNLQKIKPMYKATLDIEFPKDIGDIFRAINLRHDIVHRNGKNKDGELVKLDLATLYSLVDSVTKFVADIDTQLPINKGKSFSQDIPF